jgi:hypothetical protein
MAKRKKIKVQERKLGRELAYGLAWKDKKLIEIDSRLKGRQKFSVTLHESLHVAFPEKSERQVLKATKLIMDVLWGQNYRKVDN